MRKYLLVFAALVISVLANSYVTPAFALSLRTWVSGVGDDLNPCSRTAPCATFVGALAATSPGGEINCLDSGGFGGVTITISVSIICQTGTAGVQVSGTNGIIINAGATDKVVLDGLDIEGVGTGLNGVQINSGASVHIVSTWIRHFTQNGVNLVSSTANTRVIIKDSFIGFNAGGVNVQGSGGVPNVASLADTIVDANTTFAVQVTGAGNAIALVRSILSSSPTGLSILSGGSVISFGPSNVITGTGTVTTTVNFK